MARPDQGPARAGVAFAEVIDDELVAEAVHDTGVRRLQHAYADVVNRRAWPELDQLFVPDAPVVVDRRAGEPLRLTGGPEVGEFIGTPSSSSSSSNSSSSTPTSSFPDGAGPARR